MLRNRSQNNPSPLTPPVSSPAGSASHPLEQVIHTAQRVFQNDIVVALYDKPIQRFLKRLMDVSLCLLSLVVVLPVIGLVGAIIRLESPGPILFTQDRVGQNGRIFKIYKLRSMVLDAPERQQALDPLNEAENVVFKMKADPRITGVIGRFIRKYSIDELPQVLNIIKGEMSLVGPRPLPVENVEKFEPHHYNWFKVPQGLTGAWQTHGRSDLGSFEAIYQLERHYIEHWSLLRDILYLIKTIGVVLSGKGAY